jgi:hypothetical protein
MPKIKKSLRDKKLADNRKKLPVAAAKQPAPSTGKIEITVKSTIDGHAVPTQINKPPTAISTSSYNYLFNDLIKTTVLTSCIIVAELVIKQFAFNL